MKTHIQQLFKKLIIVSMAACCISLSGPTVHQGESAEVVDRIVAIVNEDIILLSELDRQLAPVKQQIRSSGVSPEEAAERIYEVRSALIDELIDETLADQVIRESGIRVSGGEIDAAIEQIKAINRMTHEDFSRALQARGMSMDSYREDIRQQILRNKLINEKVKSQIIITDIDIRDYYEANAEKFGITPRYRLKNIFMPYGEDRHQARRNMETVLEYLEAGASFSEMAIKHSMAPNAPDGGVLGAFALEDLSEHLQPVMASLEPGQFTDIIQTDMGFQIFYLDAIESPAKQEFETVREKIGQQLYEQKVEEKFDQWIEALRRSAHIRIIF